MGSSVKAYQFGNYILVQFYDNARGSELSCPSCGWEGEVRVERNASQKDEISDLNCPCCELPLGALQCLTATAQVNTSLLS